MFISSLKSYPLFTFQWKYTPSYNIFWSEKNSWAKLAHMFQQIFVFLLLPFVVLAHTTFSSFSESCTPCGWFIRQSQVRIKLNVDIESLTSTLIKFAAWYKMVFMLFQIPVNRFLYWEMSKLVFYGIVFCTLIDEDDVAW